MDKINITGYELLEKLGEGGMGTVYKARQISLDRLVAIKVLPRHYAQCGDYAERFLIEAKIAASLKHNNIIQVYEAGQSGEDYYFAMELVSGYTIADWLERKEHLSAEDALLIIEYIADALRYTWERAWIIHGDIKPANIMVDSDGTIKLADFLALTPPGGADRPESLKENVVGTPNFMSPEQARGVGKLDFRTDIYSLGGVFYNLVTGCIPFWQEETPQDTMRRQLTDFIPDPCELNPAIPKECAWLIEKMMVKRARDRYGSWNEVLLDIHQVKHGGMPTPPYPEKGASTVLRCRERERMIVRVAAPEDAGGDPKPRTARREFAIMRLLAYSILSILFLLSGYYLYTGYLLPAKQPAHPQTIEVSHEPPPSRKPVRPPPTPPPRPPEQGHSSPQPNPQLVEQTLQEARLDPLDDAGPQHAGQLRAYASLFEKITSLVRYRKFATAESLLKQWILNNPDTIFRERAAQDLERIEAVSRMFSSLERNPERVLGEAVRAKPRITGTLTALDGSTATITRRAGQGVHAEVSVNVNKIYDVDLQRLISKADPENQRANAVIWEIAQGQYEKAENALRLPNAPENAQELLLWTQAWEQMTDNIQALTAYDRIRQELARNQYPAADRLLRAAEQRFADTDVFTWAYPEEIDTFNARIEAFDWPAKQTGSSPSSQADANTERPPDELPEPQPVFAMENGIDINNIARYDINDVKENLVSLNGKVIRLRFRFRTDIRQTDQAHYQTELGSKSGTIPVLFTQEGFDWIKGLPRWDQNSRRRNVYGRVDSSTGQLHLMGHRRDRHNGELTGEFTW